MGAGKRPIRDPENAIEMPMLTGIGHSRASCADILFLFQVSDTCYPRLFSALPAARCQSVLPPQVRVQLPDLLPALDSGDPGVATSLDVFTGDPGGPAGFVQFLGTLAGGPLRAKAW